MVCYIVHITTIPFMHNFAMPLLANIAIGDGDPCHLYIACPLQALQGEEMRDAFSQHGIPRVLGRASGKQP